MLTLCAIASGSNGNCYYIGNNSEAVLVDAGISAKQILTRMRQCNLDPQKIRAVFITHEHNDHSYGARVLSKRLQVPVYVTSGTYKAMYEHIEVGRKLMLKSLFELPELQTINIGRITSA